MTRTPLTLYFTGLLAMCIAINAPVNNILGQVSDPQLQIVYSESKQYSPRLLPDENKKQLEQKDSKKDPTSKIPTAVRIADSSDANVTIPVSVFTHDGKFFTGLQAADFRAFVDDKQIEIGTIETKDEPLNVILLLDMSPSTVGQIKAIKDLAGRMVEHLRPDDKVMVVGFNLEVKIATELTSDRGVIAKGLKKLDMGDGTSIYNAISELFEKRLSSISGPIAIIVMTDGVDTTSRKASYQTSLLSAEKGNATVFPIYFDTYDSGLKQAAAVQSRYGVLMPQGAFRMSKEEYDLGRYYLTDLCGLSGGHAIIAKDVLDGKTGVFDGIPAELRARYYVSFRLADPPGMTGNRHQIMIRGSKPNLTLFAKGSFIEK